MGGRCYGPYSTPASDSRHGQLGESRGPGQQEGAAYNGHFECVCYHPLFLFNQFGDCEGATLRPGNVHCADGWEDLLEPVVKRYQKKRLLLLFWCDAAFAKPELYEYLEQKGSGTPCQKTGVSACRGVGDQENAEGILEQIGRLRLAPG